MTAIFDSFLHFDLSIFEWVQSIQNNILDMFFKYYTMLGEAGILFIVIAIALLITRRYRKVGFAMIVALAIMVVGNNLILKNIFARPRPFNLDPDAYAWWFKVYVFPEIVEKPSSFSFPSGHSSSAFAVAFVAMFYSRKWGFINLFLAILMAFSRVYVEVHYPSDVIAGVLVGLIYALLAAIVVKLLYPVFDRTVRKIADRKKVPAADEGADPEAAEQEEA